MKRTVLSITSLLLLLALVFSFGACQTPEAPEVPADPWADAIYTTDTALGEGALSFTLEVVCGENKVTFTLHTDEEMLGAALLSLGLIEGEEGPYGLYIKRVNGVRADYDTDGHYWALYIGGAYAITGADETALVEGGVYRFARER